MSTRIRCSSLSNRKSASALHSSVLPTPVGPRNRNEPVGPVRVGQARARAADGVGHGADRLVLADHALVQLVFHQQQLLALALHQLGHRNAGGARHHLGDLFGADHGAQQLRAAAVLGALGLARFGGLRFLEPLLQLGQPAVLQLGHLVEVALAGELLDLAAQLFDLFLDVGASPGPGPSRPSRSRRGRRFPFAACRSLPRSAPTRFLRGLVLLALAWLRARSAAGSGGGPACPSPRAWSRSRS